MLHTHIVLLAGVYMGSYDSVLEDPFSVQGGRTRPTRTGFMALPLVESVRAA